jgi:hypothetical protein
MSIKQKCSICRQPVRPDCDWNQGRCPHLPASIEIKNHRKILYLLAAPVIIIVWAIFHPRKIWQQAKKDWNIE